MATIPGYTLFTVDLLEPGREDVPRRPEMKAVSSASNEPYEGGVVALVGLLER